MQMHSLENADNVTKIEMFDIFEIHIKSRMSHLIGLIYVVRKHWYLITSPVVAQSNPPSSNLKQGVGVRRSGGELAIRQGRRKEEGGTFICHLFSTNALFPRPWTLSSLTYGTKYRIMIIVLDSKWFWNLGDFVHYVQFKIFHSSSTSGSMSL